MSTENGGFGATEFQTDVVAMIEAPRFEHKKRKKW